MMIISIVGAIATYAAVKAVEDAADRGIRNKIAEKKSAKEEVAAAAAAVPAPAAAAPAQMDPAVLAAALQAQGWMPPTHLQQQPAPAPVAAPAPVPAPAAAPVAAAPAPVSATPQWVAGQPAMFFQGAGALRPGTIATISDQGVVTLVVKSDGGGYESITGPAGNLMAVPA